MNPNEPRLTTFSETLPTALPYMPPQSQTAIASHQPREAKTTGCPSLTRITIAFFTLGLSIPFIGIRREHTTEYYK